MTKRLEDIAYFLFGALVFLLPFFFIPSSLLNFPYGKISLIFLASLVALFSWLILSFKSGNLIVSWNWLSLSAKAVVVAFFLAALFSPNKQTSFIGFGYEAGTFSVILLFFILMFLISYFVRTKNRIFYLYLWFGGGFLILALFEIIRLFAGAGILNFHYFLNVVDNPFGSWNDVAIISGLAIIVILASFEFLALNRIFKIILSVLLAMSLFLLAVANFSLLSNTIFTLFTLIGLFALLLFVYLLTGNSAKAGSARKISFPALIVLILAIIFTLAFNSLSAQLNQWFKISFSTATPTWTSSFDIARDALKRSPLVGIGPNRFSEEWALVKPDGINNSIFWNTDFNYAVGILPTFVITTGLLGLLSLLSFLGLFVYTGFKAIFKKSGDKFSQFLIISSFFSALFLWITDIFYAPGLATFALAFVWSGLFMGSLFREGMLTEKSISYVEDSRKGFVVLLSLVFLMIGLIVWAHMETNKILASIYANQAVAALNSGNLPQAEEKIARAASADKNPAYYRFLSQIELRKMSTLLQNSNLSSDSVKTEFQNNLNTAATAANVSTTLDPTDYQNWIALGDVYASAVSLGIPNSASQASSAYAEALKRNPKNPAIDLALARVALSARDNEKGREYIDDALKLKNNYADALFELGLLDYGLADYNGAVTAFSSAVAAVPTYADAKYYLGLSYYKLSKTADAEKQFEELVALNPANQSLKDMLANLKSGVSPIPSAPSSHNNATSTKP